MKGRCLGRVCTFCALVLLCVFCWSMASADEHSHDFDATTHLCSCGWKEPGLYYNGELRKTWAELVNEGYVKLDEAYWGESVPTAFVGVSKGLKGDLVVSDSITKCVDCLYLTNLTSVEFPGTIKKIDAGVWRSETLEKVIINEGTVEIETFGGAKALKDIQLPSTLKVITAGCFQGCSSLESIVLPPSIEEIGASAFSGCSSLKSINIQDTKINSLARTFTNCSSLEEIVIPETVMYLSDAPFSGTAIKSLYIPDSVVNINGGFGSMFQLEEIRMSNSVTNLTGGWGFFEDAPNLKVFYVGDNVKTISGQFLTDSGVEILILPKTLVSIPLVGFFNDGALKEVYYEGDEFEWSIIEMDGKVNYLENVTVHCGIVPAEIITQMVISDEVETLVDAVE